MNQVVITRIRSRFVCPVMTNVFDSAEERSGSACRLDDTVTRGRLRGDVRPNRPP